LEQNVEELMQELELVSNMPEGPEKQAANDELARAEAQLVDARKAFADNKVRCRCRAGRVR
jgi:hypothetical protein